jgi:uncharacterized protein (DUF608 family)
MKSDLHAWPVLTRYDRQHLTRIALPLGGIGTGTVSLGGRGDLRDWEIVNRPAKGFKPKQTFFALYAKPKGGQAVTRCLEGAIDPRDYEGAFGSPAPNHGLPRFRHCEFHAAYPFGQALLSDPDVPVDVRLQAFNPLVPADADRSGMPVAILRFVLSNKTNKTIEASVCGSLENFIGQDGSVVVDNRINTDARGGARNVNELRGFQVGRLQGVGATSPDNLTIRKPGNLSGVFMSSQSIDPNAEQWGTIALATTATRGVTHRTVWANLSWGDSLLDFWDDFSADGQLEEREADVDNPIASLAASVKIPPRGVRAITFLLTWHFPNRLGWGVRNEPSLTYATGMHDHPARVGNYYTTQFKDAWDVAQRVAAQLPELEADTLTFVNAFVGSDLPDAVKEAALYNLSTLRSQTSFRIESGHVLGWEGCGDKAGCCFGSCTHVWNYEQATAFLFGDLSRTMREVEFKYSTRSDGLMSFRADLPLDRATEWINAAADGQMGCLMKLYRDWQLSGPEREPKDDDMLRALWPKACRAMEFCWRPGGWDADEDGVMEGCQHNTMDVEYYGPNPQMGAWYLGALRAMEEMARYLSRHATPDSRLPNREGNRESGVGESEESLIAFADKCHRLFENGSRWMDEHLFNGEYYEHEIRPPRRDEFILDGLRAGMGAMTLDEPDLQLGAGCLVDQLVGQYMAHVCGLGYLLDPQKVRKALCSIMKYNFKRGFGDHFNHLRSFVLGDESALLMATYPKGRRPRRPFPYYNEVMTGFEYAAAAGMLYEGQIENGLKVIEAIRKRYDGSKRNPFDEAECGHHYARAMAAWAAMLALTGFHYSAVQGAMSFAAKDGRHFWSNGYAWGVCEQRSSAKGVTVKLSVLGGALSLKRFVLTGAGEVVFDRSKTIRRGQLVSFKITRSASQSTT